jgi:hypothetical protein
MRITSAGNVGIGTSSPGARLSVDGNIETVSAENRYIKSSGWISNQAGRDSDFGFSDVGMVAKPGTNLCFVTGNGATGAGFERLRITSTGNVGIGTSSPASRLDVTGTDNFGTTLVSRVYSFNRTAFLGFGFGTISASANSAGLFLEALGANVMAFSTNGAERARITSAGNVGIGTTDQFGGGVKVVGIANATTVPASNPTGGGVLYVEGGALKYRGSSGTVTTIANA